MNPLISNISSVTSTYSPLKKGESVGVSFDSFMDQASQKYIPATAPSTPPPNAIPLAHMIDPRHIQPSEHVVQAMGQLYQKKTKTPSYDIEDISDASAQGSSDDSPMPTFDVGSVKPSPKNPDAQLFETDLQRGLDPESFLVQAKPAQKNRSLSSDAFNNLHLQNDSDGSPFQLFMDKTMDFLQSVSRQEQKTSQLLIDYIDGKASLEELSLARTKLSIALSFTLTLISQITQTFKEVQNMQI